MRHFSRDEGVLYLGTFLAAPVILWQLWRFVAPGLYENEKKYILPVIFCSCLFFSPGILFGYFVVVPVAFKFFASLSSDLHHPHDGVDKYLSFAE